MKAFKKAAIPFRQVRSIWAKTVEWNRQRLERKWRTPIKKGGVPISQVEVKDNYAPDCKFTLGEKPGKGVE